MRKHPGVVKGKKRRALSAIPESFRCSRDIEVLDDHIGAQLGTIKKGPQNLESHPTITAK
jgi:hypothetical protein